MISHLIPAEPGSQTREDAQLQELRRINGQIADRRHATHLDSSFERMFKHKPSQSQGRRLGYAQCSHLMTPVNAFSIPVPAHGRERRPWTPKPLEGLKRNGGVFLTAIPRKEESILDHGCTTWMLFFFY